jgi:hypothetical protein
VAVEGGGDVFITVDVGLIVPQPVIVSNIETNNIDGTRKSLRAKGNIP